MSQHGMFSPFFGTGAKSPSFGALKNCINPKVTRFCGVYIVVIAF